MWPEVVWWFGPVVVEVPMRVLSPVGLLSAQHFRGKKNRVRNASTTDMCVKQIERAIAESTAKDLVELVSWLEDYHAQVWDRRIEEDLEAGRLDALLAEVDEECEAGLTQPL